MPTYSKYTPTSRQEIERARLRTLQASYLNMTRACCLAAGAATLLTVILALWVIPWVPFGMTEGDYTAAVLGALLLSIGSVLTVLIAVFMRGVAGGGAGLAEMWQAFQGNRVRLCNRQQFYNRLARECERARRDRRSGLSLILVRVQQGHERNGSGGQDAIEQVAHTMMAAVRSSDVIGIAGEDEIGVLAIGADAKARRAMSARLRRALATALAEWSARGAPGRAPEAFLAASTFDPDDSDPSLLLVETRASLSPVTLRREKAA